MGQLILHKQIKEKCASAFAAAGMTSFDDLHAKVPFMPFQTLKGLFEGIKSPVKHGTMELTQEALDLAVALKREPGVLFFLPIPEGPKGLNGEPTESVSTYDRIIKLWSEGKTPDDIAAQLKCKVASVELNFSQYIAKSFPSIAEGLQPALQSDDDCGRKFDIFLRTGKASTLNTFRKKWKKLSRSSQMEPLAFSNALTCISRHVTPEEIKNWFIPSTLFLQTTEDDDKLRRDITVFQLEKILSAYLKLGLKLPESFREALKEKCRNNDIFDNKFSELLVQTVLPEAAPS